MSNFEKAIEAVPIIDSVANSMIAKGAGLDSSNIPDDAPGANNCKITKDDAERLYGSVLKTSTLPGYQELSMLQSGSREALEYISLMLNAKTDSKTSYEHLFMSRIQYDIEHSPTAVSYNIGVLTPSRRTTMATRTTDSSITEERHLLFVHLMDRIRSAAKKSHDNTKDLHLCTFHVPAHVHHEFSICVPRSFASAWAQNISSMVRKFSLLAKVFTRHH